jgi:hypothetical protein
MKYVYHGSPNNFNIAKPSLTTRMTGDIVKYNGISLHATKYKYIALLYLFQRDVGFIHNKNKYYFNVAVSLFEKDCKITIFGKKNLDYSLNKLFSKGGYLYTFNAKDFKWVDGLGPLEVISTKALKPMKKRYIKNVPKEIIKNGGKFIFIDITKNKMFNKH